MPEVLAIELLETFLVEFKRAALTTACGSTGTEGGEQFSTCLGAYPLRRKLGVLKLQNRGLKRFTWVLTSHLLSKHLLQIHRKHAETRMHVGYLVTRKFRGGLR